MKTFTNCIEQFDDSFELTREHFRPVLTVSFKTELITVNKLHESQNGISEDEFNGRAYSINLPVNVDAVALYDYVDSCLPNLNELLENYEETFDGANWRGKIDTDVIEELFQDVPVHGGVWKAGEWFQCNTRRETVELIDGLTFAGIKGKAEELVSEALARADAQLDLDSTIEYLTELFMESDWVMREDE